MILRLTLFLIIMQLVGGDWINPHSMDNKGKIKLTREQIYENQIATQECREIRCDSDIQLKRIIRLILSNALMKGEPDYYEGFINLKLTDHEHQTLIDFSQGAETHDTTVNEIGAIFEKALHKSKISSDWIMSLEDQIIAAMFNKITALLCGIVGFLYTFYQLKRVKLHWKAMLKYFLIIGYIFDFVITYLNLWREEEIQNMVNIKKLGTVFPECDTDKMSWWNYFKTQLQSAFTEDRCTAYYRATYQYWLPIAPTKVITKQFKNLFIQPLEDLGEGLGKFGRAMFNNLPIGFNFFIFPIMLLTTCLMVFMTFLFLTNSQIKLSILKFFCIELGTSKPVEVRNNQNIIQGDNGQEQVQNRSITDKRKEVGNEIKHRNLIEDVSNNSETSQESSTVDDQSLQIAKTNTSEKVIENLKTML